MTERLLVIDGTTYALAEGTDADAELDRLAAAVRDGQLITLTVAQDRTPVTLHVNGAQVATFLLLPEGSKPSSVQ